MMTKEPDPDHDAAREFAEAVRHGTTGAANLARAYRDLEAQLATSQAAHTTTIDRLAEAEGAITGLRKRLRERASESDKRLTRALLAERRLAQAEAVGKGETRGCPGCGLTTEPHGPNCPATRARESTP